MKRKLRYGLLFLGICACQLSPLGQTFWRTTPAGPAPAYGVGSTSPLAALH